MKLNYLLSSIELANTPKDLETLKGELKALAMGEPVLLNSLASRAILRFWNHEEDQRETKERLVQKALELLLECGLDPSSRDERGQPLLFCAALSENVGAIDLLIQAGANVNQTDAYGETPLHLCSVFEDIDPSENKIKEATARNVECIKLLLAAGADFNLKDHDGDTPLDNAKKNKWMHSIMLALFEKQEIHEVAQEHKDSNSPNLSATQAGMTKRL